jgi:Leucine carboxyl methyltransferase
MNDDLIIGTNDDALVSKLSCVELQYLKDPYVSAFIKRGNKRPPIINRGTYMRTISIDKLLAEYCNVNAGNVQVVSFGAGRWVGLA